MPLSRLRAGARTRQYRASRPSLGVAEAAGGEPDDKAEGGREDCGGSGGESEYGEGADH